MIHSLLGSELSLEYISLSVIDGMLLGFSIAILLVATVLRRGSVLRNFYLTVLFVYVGAIIALTLRIVLPKGYNISDEGIETALNAINFTPFISSYKIVKNSISIDNYYYVKKLIIGNFVMLMPLGILMPLLFKKMNFTKMLIIALLSALLVEGIQLVFNILSGALIREVEIDDVILNSLGCILAYYVFSGVRKIGKRLKKA